MPPCFSATPGGRMYTQGDSDVIRRHLVGNTLKNVSHCNIAEIRFVGKLVITQTFHKPMD